MPIIYNIISRLYWTHSHISSNIRHVNNYSIYHIMENNNGLIFTVLGQSHLAKYAKSERWRHYNDRQMVDQTNEVTWSHIIRITRSYKLIWGQIILATLKCVIFNIDLILTSHKTTWHIKKNHDVTLMYVKRMMSH